MARNLSDAYANLDLVESVLSLALRVPRRPPGRIVDTHNFLLPDEEIRKVRAQLEEAQAELGPDFAEFRAVMRREDDSIRGLLVNYPTGKADVESLREYFTMSVETWACTIHHSTQHRRMIELLIALRRAIIETMRVMPHEIGGPGPIQVQWERTPEGHIVVSFASFFREIKEERLAWIFEEVAQAKGNEVTWEDLLVRRMRYRAEVLGAERVENLAVDSLVRYGRDIRAQLHPFGDLWEHTRTGVRWHGDTTLAV